MDLMGNINTIMSMMDIFSILSPDSSIISLTSNVEPETIVAIEYDFPAMQIEWSNALARDRFPEDFKFGVATSAYQIEGAWNVSGKGESIWDYATHREPSLIADKANADVSADSYHKYKQDIQLAKSIGSKMYKISLSWSRILPTGYSNYVNENGIRYYNDTINEMLANNITPMVVLHQRDLPKPLQDLGGWTNPMISSLFAAYARIAFAAFGDRVKHWVTINEPTDMCIESYGGGIIPGLNQPGVADYLCLHNVLLAHVNAYEIYDDEFRASQDGKVGVTHKYSCFEPNDVTSMEDVMAVENAHRWYNDWFLHPLFTPTGDYPDAMIDKVVLNSLLQGLPYSRLPVFTMFDVSKIRNSADFLGLNCHDVKIVCHSVQDSTDEINFDNDAGISKDSCGNQRDAPQNPSATLRKILNHLDGKYLLPEIFITENGYADGGDILDINRVIHYHHHISETLKAMQSGVLIRGYLAWSLIDHFDWQYGYLNKYGIFHVDFDNKDRLRTPKLSSRLLTNIYNTGSIPDIDEFLNTTVTEDSVLLFTRD